MADTQTTSGTRAASTSSTAPAAPVTAMSVVAPAVAWLIPGLGHIIQRRWIRGLLLMVSVVA
ncbi:MAG TPA: DUF6677 family protein, partial [Candidatus Angelobacter sp.]|nr:DUF6677 family protein [Candidatus Angelobacter sp.]